jgi:hypothetical protein
MFLKKLANGVAEFYLLLSSSQELSFKCWENLVMEVPEVE